MQGQFCFPSSYLQHAALPPPAPLSDCCRLPSASQSLSRLSNMWQEDWLRSELENGLNHRRPSASYINKHGLGPLSLCSRHTGPSTLHTAWESRRLICIKWVDGWIIHGRGTIGFHFFTGKATWRLIFKIKINYTLKLYLYANREPHFQIIKYSSCGIRRPKEASFEFMMLY